MAGSLQITVDLAGTFDAMPRQQGLLGMDIPHKVIDVVMTWHQQAQYSIRHDDSDRHIESIPRAQARVFCSFNPMVDTFTPH